LQNASNYYRLFATNLENAWIVPIKDAVEIKNKVLEILDSNSSIKTENAYREIQQFDWKKFQEKC